MYKILYRTAVFLTIFLMILAPVYAQTVLTHDTGTMTAAVFDNGFVADDANGAAGGITFLGNLNASYTAGIMLGTAANGVSGMIGSFTDGLTTIVYDMVNAIPMTGFFPVGMYDQVTSAGYTDMVAPVPYGLDIEQMTYSYPGSDYISIKYTITNNTGSTVNGLYVGFFNDWDVGSNNYGINLGDYDLSRGLIYQWEQGGAIDPNYYGLVAYNGMASGLITSDFPGDNATIRNVLFDWISSNSDYTTPAVPDDYRSFIGSGPYNLDNGMAVVVGFGVVAGASVADIQSNTDMAIMEWYNDILPVELTSFTAVQQGSEVKLEWRTATEINNQGFEIERKIDNSDWQTLAFKQGMGTYSEPVNYTYLDDISGVQADQIEYRLKQIDYDGRFEFSDVVTIESIAPLEFALHQNYPNPFNPSTQIQYDLPEDNFVTICVYNTLGEEVAELVNELKEAGTYIVNFDASYLSAGVYIYSIRAGNNNAVKKMMLIK